MGTKKIVTVVALIVVIVVAVVYIAKRGLGRATAKPPDRVMAQIVQKVDEETHEFFDLSRAEWEKLGSRDGKYKNPKTGTYTIVPSIVCQHCRKRTVGYVLPSPKGYKTGLDYARVTYPIISSVRCIHCGKVPFPLPPEPRPE